MSEPSPAFARPAATVLLVRQRQEMEVLMVERHSKSHYASALVFPGGVVDAADSADLWRDLAVGGGDLTADDRALRICGYRELFEETGLLVGERALAAMGEPGPAGDAYAFALVEAGARLDLGAMHRFAHWVTPPFAPKRFDTHFFLCALEAEVEPISDGHETVFVAWLSPPKALDLAARGERKILFPTRLNLELLAKSGTVAEAVAAAKARRIVTVSPRMEQRPAGAVLTVPEDAGYGPAFELVEGL